MSEPTTIIWTALPRNGNGGSALVKWRLLTDDIGYALGAKPPRYPVPALYRPIDLTTYWLLPVGSSVALLSEYWFKWRNAASYGDPYLN